MIWLKLFLFFQICLLAQIKCPDALWGFPIPVEFLFVGVVLFAARFGLRFGVLAGLLAGGLQDSLSLAPFGWNLFSFSFVGGLVGGMRHLFYLNTNKSLLLLVSAFSVLLFFIRVFTFGLSPLSSVMGGLLLTECFPLLFWNSCVAPLFIFMMNRFGLAFTHREEQVATTANIFDQFRRRMEKNPSVK